MQVFDVNQYNYKWFIRKTVTLSATLSYLVPFKILFPEKIIFPFAGFHGKILQTLIRFCSVKSIILFSVSPSVTQLGTTLVAHKTSAFLISLYKSHINNTWYSSSTVLQNRLCCCTYFVHSLESDETPSILASHQASNYVQL